MFLFLVAGCETSTKTNDINVRVGFNGLTMEFLKNTPPARIFEDDVIPVYIRVKNSGAYTIQEKDAVLSIAVENDYTKRVELLGTGNIEKETGNAAKFPLEGKSNFNPNGEEILVSYNLYAGKVDPQSEFHSSTVAANLCYPYETVFSDTICIDTDVSNLKPGKKVCNIQDLAPANGQGAPIAVTKVEISMLPTEIDQNSQTRSIKPQFLMLIENKGSGTPVKRESTKDFCMRSDIGTNYNENINRINVKAFLSDKELDCTPKGRVDGSLSDQKYAMAKLKDKKEIIRCSSEALDASQDSYLSTLKIVMTYGYTQSIAANYLIQKATR